MAAALSLAVGLAAGGTCLDQESCRSTDISCNPAAFALLYPGETVVYVVGFKRITAGDTDWWIKKYSSDGVEDTLNWNKTFDGGIGGSDRPLAVAIDRSGAVYVGGIRDAGGPGGNWWIKKFSSDGVEDTLNWDKSFDGGGAATDELYDLATDAVGNVYAAGRRANPGADWWIKKYTADGIEDTANWNKTINGPAGVTDDARSVFVAPDGSIFVAGQLETAGDFWDMHIKRFSADGIEDTASWNKTFAGGNSANDYAEHALVAADGSVYVAGVINRATTGDDWWLKKFSLDGIEDTMSWDLRIDGGFASGDLLRSFTADPFGNVYAGGRFDISSNNRWSIRRFNSAGVADLNWVIDYDADAASLLDDVFAMASDRFGNIYAAGLCSRPATGEDWCIKKYNNFGVEDTTNWNKIFDGGVGLNEWATAIAVQN